MSAIILLSGGLDSTVLLAHLLQAGEKVEALTISYGQRHSKETEAAEKVANYYKVPLHKADIPVAKFSESTLTQPWQDIPEGPYTSGETPSTFVPNRNGIFLNFAAMLAHSRGISSVTCAVHGTSDGDTAYPDCTPDFINAVDRSIRIGTGYRVKVKAPFVKWTKRQIVARGVQLLVPFSLTWSCYNSGNVPCEKCATCLERADAFVSQGLEPQ